LRFNNELSSGKRFTGGATLCNKVSKLAHYKHVWHTLSLTCAKNHVGLIKIIFGSFILENAEWPRFWPTLYIFLLLPAIYCHFRLSVVVAIAWGHSSRDSSISGSVAVYLHVQCAAKKTPLQKLQYHPSTKTSISSKWRNSFVRNFQRLLRRKCTTDGTRFVQYYESLCK